MSRMNLFRRLCFGLSISNWGQTLASPGSWRRLGLQRSWYRLRLATEQGKQLALNSERIASLYDLEGYRLALSGARWPWAPSFCTLALQLHEPQESANFISYSVRSFLPCQIFALL